MNGKEPQFIVAAALSRNRAVANIWLGLNDDGETVMFFTSKPVAENYPGLTIQEYTVQRAGVQLAKTRIKRIYIAGPMTGLPEQNFPAFNACAAMLRERGWHVENPAEHGMIPGAIWEDYLRYDLGRLVTCEAVYLLPGWSKSPGAILEVDNAKRLGLTLMYALEAERG